MATSAQQWHRPDRRDFIGGSDARIIMGDDEPALIRLWREKRGEIEPKDLCDNLIVQLGVADESRSRHVPVTEPNRRVSSGVPPVLPGFPLLGFTALLTRTRL